MEATSVAASDRPAIAAIIRRESGTVCSLHADFLKAGTGFQHAEPFQGILGHDRERINL